MGRFWCKVYISGKMWGKVVAFRGINAVNIDSKGRFAMPTKYRAELGAQANGRVIITIDTDERCLLLYPLDVWEEIEEKLQEINKAINTFQESSKEDMQKQFASSNKVIKEVTSELEKIKGTNEQVLNFANQMKTLEKILSNQKQRGILGEIQLENLLANVLPPELFQMQYSFNSGELVDATKEFLSKCAWVTLYKRILN